VREDRRRREGKEEVEDDKGRKEKEGVGNGGKRYGREKRTEISIVFWNEAGLRNKDKDFWKGLERWDVVVMMETWVEDKDWGRMRDRIGYRTDTFGEYRKRKGKVRKEEREE